MNKVFLFFLIKKPQPTNQTTKNPTHETIGSVSQMLVNAEDWKEAAAPSWHHTQMQVLCTEKEDLVTNCNY